MTSQLPMLEYVNNLYPKASLKNVRLICCQHLMESTFQLFCSLTKKGLKFENISVLGKCYSTNLGIIKEMEEAGIDVSSLSTYYNSDLSFDVVYKQCVIDFFKKSINKENIEKYEKIIFLDDGGYLIQEAAMLFGNDPRIVGIEQTSSGYQHLHTFSLNFPVINVARSSTKLELEAPIIAESALQQLENKIDNFNGSPRNILVLGNGAIGKVLYKKMSHFHQVHVFDACPELSDFSESDLNKRLIDYDLLIGCTGKTSISKTRHDFLKKGAMLASVSSSDREFDAVHLRKGAPFHRCHEDLKLNNMILFNSGFPINFFGTRNNIPLSLIQITLSLLAAAIFESNAISNSVFPKIRSLNKEIERKIRLKFIQISTIQHNKRTKQVPAGCMVAVCS